MVKDMTGMFNNDYSLTTLNLSSFRTDNIISMNYTFANCYNLLSLDISYFNSSNSTIEGIFANSTKLEIIKSNDENICNLKPLGSICESNYKFEKY